MTAGIPLLSTPGYSTVCVWSPAASAMSMHQGCDGPCGTLVEGMQKYNKKRHKDLPCNIWGKICGQSVKGLLLNQVVMPDICDECGWFRLQCLTCQKKLSANNINGSCGNHPCVVRSTSAVCASVRMGVSAGKAAALAAL
eukprot:350500-Chlamydomonas_euryale.AAC.14